LKQSLDFNKAAPIDTSTALNKFKTSNLIRDKNNRLYQATELNKTGCVILNVTVANY